MKKNIIPAFWFFFLYIIAAIFWWFIVLEKQNDKIFTIQTQGQHLPYTEFRQKEEERKRNTLKHIGEGSVSLIIILLGAGLLYSLLKRTFYIAHKERNFILAISHELRTPLASIQLNLETLRKRVVNEDTKHQLLGASLQEVKRLEILYNNVITTSRLTDEGKVLQKNFQPIYLSSLLYQIVWHFQRNFPAYTFSLSNHASSNVHIMGDKNLVHLLFQNLLDNAVKYSPQDHPHIYIDILEHNNNIRIAIKDEGIGIDAHHRKYIFQKFYRIQNEHTRHTKGTGLGLYIVHQTVLLHKGSIEVKHNHPKGSMFVLHFNKS